ncbi:unnamed protein product [Coregonus sp. 'balchen']|nr:unnamed protein product [Coregonus sp. 'balchen']
MVEVRPGGPNSSSSPSSSSSSPSVSSSTSPLSPTENNAERLRRATERLRSPVVFSQEPAVRKTQLRSFSQYVEARPDVSLAHGKACASALHLAWQINDKRKNQRKKEIIIIRSPLPSLLGHSGKISGGLMPRKAFKDTSQYVVGELSALESEQRHIDARAARVEKRLRYLMDTGVNAIVSI